MIDLEKAKKISAGITSAMNNDATPESMGALMACLSECLAITEAPPALQKLFDVFEEEFWDTLSDLKPICDDCGKHH